MFDEASVTHRWTIRLVRLSVAAAAATLLGWWALQLFAARGSGTKSPKQQVAVLRDRAEKAFARRVAAESLKPADASIAGELTAELATGDAVGREMAALALGHSSNEPAAAIDALISALKDASVPVRRQAAIALGRIGARPEEASAALAESLRQGGVEDRGEFIRALRRLDGAGIRFLREFLADDDAELRRRVVIELGRAGDGEFLDALRGCLRDPDFRVRAETQAALWRHSAIGADELTAALHDAHPVVRATACALLGRMGDEAAPAIPELAGLLAAEDVSALHAVQALGAIGQENAESISQLAALVEGKDEQMAEQAAKLLSELGLLGEDIRDRLLARIDDPRSRLAQALISALHDTGLEGQLRPPHLIAALEEAGEGVRSLVLWDASVESPLSPLGRGRRRDRQRDDIERGYGITGQELARLAGLRDLKMLDLRDNPIDDAALERLAAFQRLEWLILDRTKITSAGLVHLAGLTQLRRLSLGDCKIDDAGLEHVKALSSLEVLMLDNTQITDSGVERLAGLKRLKRLGLSRTKATDAGLASLKELPRLEEVGSSRGQFTLRGLSQLKGLVAVRLRDTAVPNDDLALLAGMPRLETLVLSRSSVTDAGLAHVGKLTQLKSLWLDQTAISDAGLARLYSLVNLESLAIADTDASIHGVESLEQALPRLEAKLNSGGSEWRPAIKSYLVVGLSSAEEPDAAPSVP